MAAWTCGATDLAVPGNPREEGLSWARQRRQLSVHPCAQRVASAMASETGGLRDQVEEVPVSATHLCTVRRLPGFRAQLPRGLQCAQTTCRPGILPSPAPLPQAPKPRLTLMVSSSTRHPELPLPQPAPRRGWLLAWHRVSASLPSSLGAPLPEGSPRPGNSVSPTFSRILPVPCFLLHTLVPPSPLKSWPGGKMPVNPFGKSRTSLLLRESILRTSHIWLEGKRDSLHQDGGEEEKLLSPHPHAPSQGLLSSLPAPCFSS